MSRKNGFRSPWSFSVRTLALALLAAILAAASSRAETVSGKILDPDGKPLKGVIVTFDPLPFGSPVTATTATDGTYTVDLDPGCWDMQIDDIEFGTLLYPGTIFDDDQEAIDVESGHTITDLNLQYPIGHSIGGTFTAAGAPPTAFTVGLYGMHGEPTALLRNFTSATWNIPYVPDGKYLLWGDDAGFPRKYSKRLFGAASDALGDATVINLTGNHTDFDLALLFAPAFVGHVTFPGGGTGAGIRVSAYTRGGQDVFTGFTDGSGNFRITDSDLTPGYQGQLVAFGTTANPFWTALGNTTASFPVTFSDWNTASPGDNTGLNIDGQTPGTITGKVLESGTNNPIAGVSVQVQDAVRLGRLGYAYWNSSPSAADGSYTAKGIQPNHRYWLSAFVPSIDYHMSFQTGPIFEVLPGTTSGKDIHLDLGGKIGGTIKKASDSSPVSGVQIQFYDDCLASPRGYGYTGADGKFLSSPLPGGTYKYQAVPPAASVLKALFNGGAAACNAAPGIHVTPGATTTSDLALPAGSVGPAGHAVSGKITDAGDGRAVRQAFVEIYNSMNFYFASVDPCGDYSMDGVLDGTYNVFADAQLYETLSQTAGLTVNGADVVKNFVLTALKGGITGYVQVLRPPYPTDTPLQGIRVCTTTGNNCALTDSSGHYTILGLDTGTVKLIATATDNLEPRFYNGKTSLAAADVVTVTNGTITTGKNFGMAPVAADPSEPDDATTPVALALPESDPGPPRLLPDAPQNRSFKDTEDSDWFRFTATSGKIYHVTVTGGGFTQYGPYFTVFDGVTKLPDTTVSNTILSSAGWTAPTTGERWIGMSSAFSGSYTITLTESLPGPPSPTVTSIAPASGSASGGTSITITGTNFAAGATVKFGTVAATNVVFVGATTITCKAPALPGGALYDVIVTNTSTKSGTLTKGWLADFLDVPQSYIYHGAIEKVLRAGITSGCGGGNYCAQQLVTRDQMSVFILRGEHGGTYNPPAATGTVFSDVTTSTPFAKWMERFAAEGISTGCGGGSPPPYCPTQNVTRNAMAKFLLLGKHGSSFNPPAATGTVFSDVQTTTTLAKWMEELKTEGITQGCLAGVPLPSFCPNGTVTRGEMAKFVRAAFGL